MRIFKLGIFAVFSVGWLVPLVLAWNSVLSYLNDDLARLHLQGARPVLSSKLVINEAINITSAREMLYVAAAWLALVIIAWCVKLFHAQSSAAAVAEQQKWTLSVMPDSVDLPAAAEAVSAALASRAEEIRTSAASLEETMQRQLQTLESRLQELGTMVREGNRQVDDQLGNLRGQVQAINAAAVNSSNFGDLTPVTSDAKRLQQVMLNLSDLQADLRMMRRKQRSG